MPRQSPSRQLALMKLAKATSWEEPRGAEEKQQSIEPRRLHASMGHIEVCQATRSDSCRAICDQRLSRPFVIDPSDLISRHR
jgi:hypothetical protein